MAVEKVARTYVIAHASARDRLLEALQEASIVHLEPLAEDERAALVEPLEVDTREVERRASELEGAIDYLGRFAREEQRRLPAKGSPRPPVPEVLAEVRRLQAELAELDVREARLVNAIQHVRPWEALPVPVEWLSSTPSVTVLVGTVPSRSLPGLREDLSSQGSAWILEEVGTFGGKAQVVLIDLVDEAPEAERLLREAGFQPMLFPLATGTVGDMVVRLESDIEAIRRARAAAQARLAELAAERARLMAAYDEVAVELQRLHALRGAVGTRESVVLAGWVRAADLGRLERLAEEWSGAVVVRDPLPHEEPPVALQNPGVVEPCEAVTGLYGMPKYREIDPTPLLAPFFVVCFGIAVGEGGYGVVLAIAAKLARRFMKLGEGARRLVDLLFYCGISTFIAGVLMGSFFAIDFSKMPPSLAVLSTIHDRLMQMDPLNQPLTFLGLVLGLGFLQVWCGVLIGAVVLWRAGQRAKAVFYNGGWLALLPLTGLLVVRPVVAGVPVLYPWLLAVLSVFLSAGVGASSVAARLGAGFFALYGITGFFGDVLSYSRLFALGLATGVMATVINILAGVAGGIPVIGWAAMALILLVGHPVNIAINALGAFVHSARLQFVEFFTKFFEGGGRRFEPFCRRLKYATIVGTQAHDASTEEHASVAT